MTDGPPRGDRNRSALPVIALIAGMLVHAVSARADTILEQVSFPGLGRDGRRLTALMSRPEGAGPFPAAVLLHGCSGMFAKNGRLNARQRYWDDTLRNAGFVTLHVDSFSPRGVKEICTLKDRPVTVWDDRRSDAYAGLSFLKSFAFVRPDAIAALGWSNGGSAVLAAMDREGLPGGDGFYAGIAVYPACRWKGKKRLNPSGPLLLLLGEADDWTPPDRCEPLVGNARERGETVEVKIYPGAFHGFDWPGNELHLRRGLALVRGGAAHVGENPAARLDAAERVTEFLERHLPRSTPQ